MYELVEHPVLHAQSSVFSESLHATGPCISSIYVDQCEARRVLIVPAYGLVGYSRPWQMDGLSDTSWYH